MCGIAGLFYLKPSDHQRNIETYVHHMTDTLEHRGPDSQGVWIDQAAGAALGHRRLAIRDLSALGAQPMVSSCGRYVIVYNGEVYSHQEIAADLHHHGRFPKGDSDTEVILEACAEWGVDATVKRLIGMFAFALYDRHLHKLTLVRDRLGIKPLYWGIVDNVLIFGSELKALRAFPHWTPMLDRHSVASFVRFSYIPAPHTIYRHIHKLEPGCLLELTSCEDFKINRYWNLRSVVENNTQNLFQTSEKSMIEGLEMLLQDAVGRRLVADVPVGAFLSGGIDSSLVTALMCEKSSQTVNTFSIGFEEQLYNEAPFAAEVAQHLGTHHTELYMKSSQVLDLVERLPYWYDEPFGDSSQIPTLFLSQLTRQKVTVALSGDGGDEIFAGYSRYFQNLKLQKNIEIISLFLGKNLSYQVLAGGIKLATTLKFLNKLNPSLGGKLARCQDLTGINPFRHPNALYKFFMSHWQNPDALVLNGQEHSGIFENLSLSVSLPNSLNRMQYIDTALNLPDDILTKVDRASMSVGLEVRVPLLDHRVVEYAWRLPQTLKVQQGQTKWILRQLLYKRVPQALMDRPKKGFMVPLNKWLHSPLKEWAGALLDPFIIKTQGVFSPILVQERWQDHLKGYNNAYPLWNILMVQAWLKANPEVSL